MSVVTAGVAHAAGALAKQGARAVLKSSGSGASKIGPMARALVNDTRGAARNDGVKRLGLGLDEGNTREGYRAWADRKGFKTYDQLSPRALPDLKRVQHAMKQADEIHFNMEEFEAPMGPKLETVGNRPSFGFTTLEYSTVRTQYLDKTTFWLGDEKFVGPHTF